MINISKTELSNLLFYSFRYALGRKTYCVLDVTTSLIRHKDSLTPADRSLICFKIETAIQEGNAGMLMDVEEWKNVMRALGESHEE